MISINKKGTKLIKKNIVGFFRYVTISVFGFNPILWIKEYLCVKKLIGNYNVPFQNKNAKECYAIIIIPWLGIAVPWFSIICGLFIQARGKKVKFIVDDVIFGQKYFGSKIQLICITSVLNLLGENQDIIKLSGYISRIPLNSDKHHIIDELAKLNAVWALRGEMSDVGRNQYIMRATRQLSVSYGAISKILQSGNFNSLLVPGGIWGSSGLWTKLAKTSGIRVSTFDSSGFGVLMLAVNGIASQLQDIPEAFSLLKKNADSFEAHSYIVEAALNEMDKRRSGNDKFASQLLGASSKDIDRRFEGAVLLALNSSWDSAALGLHGVFKNNKEWIIETTQFILNHTSVPVIIRQHPVERLEIAHTSDDYRGLLTRHFGNNPRLFFIAADEEVNSYDLINQVVAVVVHTSTLGIEAVIHGKNVVTQSNSYYADLGFVRKASSLNQYHDYLLDAVSNPFGVSQTMRDDALYCYYLTQCCNWVFSPFNPEGFMDWSSYNLAALSMHEKVQMTIDALVQNIPIAYLNHTKMIHHQS